MRSNEADKSGKQCGPKSDCGWLGGVMVLGSFQYRVVLLFWHIAGQAPAVLAAGAGQVSCYFFVLFFLSRLSYLPFSNASFLGRWLDILKYCGLGHYNPTVVVSYYRRRAR